MSVQEYRKHHQHYIELSKVNVIKSFHELEALFLRNNLSMQIICCTFVNEKQVYKTPKTLILWILKLSQLLILRQQQMTE